MSLAPAWLIPADLSGGNEARLLRGGDALFPRMLAAVDAARREVWVDLHLHHDETGLRLCARLVAAARRGVKVCVVVDGFGSKDIPCALQREFAGSGVAGGVPPAGPMVAAGCSRASCAGCTRSCAWSMAKWALSAASTSSTTASTPSRRQRAAAPGLRRRAAWPGGAGRGAGPDAVWTRAGWAGMWARS